MAEKKKLKWKTNKRGPINLHGHQKGIPIIPTTRAYIPRGKPPGYQNMQIPPGILHQQEDNAIINPHKWRVFGAPILCAIQKTLCQRPTTPNGPNISELSWIFQLTSLLQKMVTEELPKGFVIKELEENVLEEWFDHLAEVFPTPRQYFVNHWNNDINRDPKGN